MRGRPVGVPWPTVLGWSVIALLAGHALTRWPFWSAEVWTFEVAKLDWSRLYFTVASDRHPPLHYGLMKGILLLGGGDAALRLPSALGALGAVVAGGRAARRLVGAGAESATVVLLALSPVLLAWAGVARAYALLAFVGAALLWAVGEVEDSPKRGAVVLGLASIAGLYLHYAALGPIVGAGIGALLVALRRPDRRQATLWVGGAFALAALAFLPWALGPLRYQAGFAHTAPRSTEVWAYLLWPVDEYTPGVMVPLAGLAALGLLVALRRGRVGLAAMGLAGLFVPWLLSLSAEVGNRLYVQLGFLPAWAALVAMGIGTLVPRPGLGAAALVVLLAGPALTVVRLPSAPFGPHGSGADDGVYRADLTAGILDGAGVHGIVAQQGLDTSLWNHYAEGLFVPEAGAATWTARPGAGRGADAACSFAHAFPFTLEGTDAAACAALERRLADEDGSGPILLERGLLERAVERSPGTGLPALALARDRLEQGDAEGALDAVDRGLPIALRWAEAEVAADLLGARAAALRLQGRSAGAEAAERSARCVLDQRILFRFRELCLLPWVREELIARSPRQRRAR